jgi:beta-lactamase class A
MIDRRQFTTSVGAAVLGWRTTGRPVDAHAGALSEGLTGDLARIEAASGGRLGVAVLDTLSESRVGHRADERFPMCSTFKLLAAAAVLARVDAGREQLDRRIRFASHDVVVNSLLTKDRAGGAGMSLEELFARRAVRSRDDRQRQHRRQSASRRSRRARRVDRLCAIAG